MGGEIREIGGGGRGGRGGGGGERGASTSVVLYSLL